MTARWRARLFAWALAATTLASVVIDIAPWWMLGCISGYLATAAPLLRTELLTAHR